MARTLFGTDGVRGVAGELLTADLAVKLHPPLGTEVVDPNGKQILEDWIGFLTPN